MDAKAFLTSTEVALPLVRSDEDFLDFMRLKLEAYCALVNRVTHEDEVTRRICGNRDTIQTITNQIIEVITDYKKGNSFESSAKFQRMMVPLKPHLDQLIIDAASSDFGPLYRIREAEPGRIAFTKGELFHIPFQDRHKVGTQRYSIPGLPCLYLGGTLYVCWEELNRPSFHNVFMSRYETVHTGTMKFLDFTPTPSQYAEWISPTNPMADRVSNFAVLWPIIASCSVRTKHQKANFKFEYVIPQMLLEWIRL